MAASRPRVEAAGGVLWRRARSGVEIALVHRPKYDDWSLPKGKLDDGEDALAAAVRELEEETGSRVVAGPVVGTSRYDVLLDGMAVPKRVTWWSVEHVGGTFVSDSEVDALRWCRPDEAEQLLSAGRDLLPLRTALALLGSTTLVLVRHASAGSRSRWSGTDSDRPLDDRGQVQATALAAQLAPYGPCRLISAPPLRCRATLEPLAASTGLELGLEPLLGDDGFDPVLSPARLLALTQETAGAVLVCSQGGAIPGLLGALLEGSVVSVKDPHLRKAATWVITLKDGVLVALDQRPPPVSRG